MLGIEAQASGGVRLVGQHCGEEANTAGIREGVERMPKLRFQGLADPNKSERVGAGARGVQVHRERCDATRIASCSEEGLAGLSGGHAGATLGRASLRLVFEA